MSEAFETVQENRGTVLEGEYTDKNVGGTVGKHYNALYLMFRF
jgi:hypothetical protein